MSNKKCTPGSISDKRLYIFDMDGTIYLGSQVFDFARTFIKNLRASGRRVIFFTNNASHDHEFYIDKLTRMGFEATEDEIMTSADVTIGYLKSHRDGKSVYLVGTPELEKEFISSGIIPVGEDCRGVDIVVSSFDTTLTYKKLEAACRYIRSGAEFFSTHPDYNCPTETGFIPDSGAISAFITASTGAVPKYFGKPYSETIEMICEMTGIDKEDMCIFGDRLYTDIALGKRFGVCSCLVLTGETTMDDVNTADEADKPDLVFNSLADADKVIFG